MVLSFKVRTAGEIEYTGNVPPATVQQLYRPTSICQLKLQEECGSEEKIQRD
jgi:hypothetical protein